MGEESEGQDYSVEIEFEEFNACSYDSCVLAFEKNLLYLRGKVIQTVEDEYNKLHPPQPEPRFINIKEINEALKKPEEDVVPETHGCMGPNPNKGRREYKLHVYEAQIAVKVRDLQARMDALLKKSKERVRLNKQKLALIGRLNKRKRLASNKDMYAKRENYLKGALEIIRECTSPMMFRKIIADCRKSIPILEPIFKEVTQPIEQINRSEIIRQSLSN